MGRAGRVIVVQVATAIIALLVKPQIAIKSCSAMCRAVLGLFRIRKYFASYFSLGPGMDSQGINKAFFIFAVREYRHVVRPATSMHRVISLSFAGKKTVRGPF